MKYRLRHATSQGCLPVSRRFVPALRWSLIRRRSRQFKPPAWLGARSPAAYRRLALFNRSGTRHSANCPAGDRGDGAGRARVSNHGLSSTGLFLGTRRASACFSRDRLGRGLKYNAARFVAVAWVAAFLINSVSRHAISC